MLQKCWLCYGSQGFLCCSKPLASIPFRLLILFSCKLLQNVFCNCPIFPCCLSCGTFPVQMLVVYASHLAFAWALNDGGPRRLWYLGNISAPQRNPVSGTPDMVISMSKFKTIQISKEIRTFESSMLQVDVQCWQGHLKLYKKLKIYIVKIGQSAVVCHILQEKVFFSLSELLSTISEHKHGCICSAKTSWILLEGLQAPVDVCVCFYLLVWMSVFIYFILFCFYGVIFAGSRETLLKVKTSLKESKIKPPER